MGGLPLLLVPCSSSLPNPGDKWTAHGHSDRRGRALGAIEYAWAGKRSTEKKVLLDKKESAAQAFESDQKKS